MPSADAPHVRARLSSASPPRRDARDLCDVCGRDELYDLKCKVVCRNCRSIVRSCADLD